MTKHLKIIIVISLLIVSAIIVILLIKFTHKGNPTCPVCSSDCPHSSCPTCTICKVCPKTQLINNFPTESGQYYIQSKTTNLYLTNTGQMVPSIADATLFSWDSTKNILTPSMTGGYSLGLNFTDAGVVLNEYGYTGTIFALASTTGKTSSTPLQTGNIADIGLTVGSLQTVGNTNMQNFYANLVQLV